MLKTITTKTTPFTPEDVDYCSERLQVLNNHYMDMIDQKKIISGSYCIAKDGKVFAHAAIGSFCYKEEDERPSLPDNIYLIASMTKLFTATAIFKLVEDGKMRVGQRVSDFLEEFKNPPFNDITVAHLLSHTSGFPADESAFNYKYYASPWGFIDNIRDQSWIAASLHMGLAAKTGTQWRYCSFGYALLGEIISRVSGIFAHDYIMDNIVIPCEMKETSFGRKIEYIDRYNIRTSYDEEQLQILKSGEVHHDDKHEFFRALHIPNTGGGLYSSTGDIIKFGIMLSQNGYYNGKRILGRKAVEKMTTHYTNPSIQDFCWGSNGNERPYGLGPDMKFDDDTLYSCGSYLHEGFGGISLVVDPKEHLVAACAPQFVGDGWYSEALWNASSIIWSGLK